MSDQNYFVDTPWTWRERWRFRLFPARHCALPEAPAHYADCVVVTTTAELSWPDRVRVLFSGRLTIQTKTVTEHVVGDTKTASVAFPSLRPIHDRA